MRAAILSVGTELLFGQITNTNTVYLSQQLNMLGYDVMYHYTVGDNPKRMAEMIRLAFSDCDLVLTTGGLGPTQDDLTKEIACEVMDDKLVLVDDMLAGLLRYFDNLGEEMTENNRKQAVMPSRAQVFDNETGSAPGFALAHDGKYIICMPGPPGEMKPMFQNSVKPFLQKMSQEVIYYRMVRAFGIGESRLETELLELIDGQSDPTLATYAKEGECALRIASKRRTLAEAQKAVDDMLEKVMELVGEYVYSCEDEELVQVVCRKLMEKNLTISCAESCTGGKFAAALTDIPGISKCFQKGFVTYSNEAKAAQLGVSTAMLERFGAVSEEIAREMAEGLARVSGSDISVSVTGIAGPGGGTEKKPVGLIYVGLRYQGKTYCRKLQTGDDDRSWNRQYAVLSMLDMINRAIS